MIYIEAESVSDSDASAFANAEASLTYIHDVVGSFWKNPYWKFLLLRQTTFSIIKVVERLK